MKSDKPVKVFASFVTPYLYGMERSVIAMFSVTKPEIIAHFFMTNTTRRLNLPVLQAVIKAQINYSFLSDKQDWPTIRKPRTFYEALMISVAILRSNWDTFKASKGHDIFYISSLRSIYNVLVTILWYRLHGKPVVYGFHDTLHKPSRLLRYLGPLISHYVFHSHFTKTLFEAHNQWAISRQSKVIPIIVISETSYSLPLKNYARAIVYAGQISRYKGVDILLDAFSEIVEHFDDVTIHFVGQPHDDYEFEFKQWLNSPKVKNRAFHWGYQKEVLDFIKGAYVFVQPSRPSMFAESFGRGVVEAMAVGVPSICFKSGALPEHVLDNETGLVCEDETVECLAKNLKKLLDDNALRDRLANNAREHYQTHYSIDVVRQKWVNFFQELNTTR